MTTTTDSCPPCRSTLFDVSGVAQKRSGIGRWRQCGSCGYPLDVASKLDRIDRARASIKEAFLVWLLADHVEPRRLDIREALCVIATHERFLFPEYESEDLVVMRIENNLFVFNFGDPDSVGRFVTALLGVEENVR